MKNLLIHRMLFGILTIASTISVWSLRLDAGTLTWAAKLRADQIFATSRGSTTYYSSTQLLVYWTAPGFSLDHYHLTIEELVAGTSTTSTFTSGTTSTFLENLKSSTGYLFTLKACLDAACSTYVDADSTAVGTTSQEVWQLRGTGNSFSTCDKVVSDGEVLSAAFRYGSSSLPGSKDGSYRMYYRPAQRPVGSPMRAYREVAVALSDADVANYFSDLGFGLQEPGGPTSGHDIVSTLSASQGIPMTGTFEGVRLYFNALDADGTERIVYLDSQDDYAGMDFNPNTMQDLVSTATEWTTTCAPTPAVGVDSDTTAGGTGLDLARQFKIGLPLIDDWLWDGTRGPFMLISGDNTDGTGGIFYAFYTGSQWNVYRSSGATTATPLISPGHGPVIQHLGDQRYKLYYESGLHSACTKPFEIIYADGANTGDTTVVDFDDFEDPADARDVIFLWPDDSVLAPSEESGLADHFIILPDGTDLANQVMYLNLGPTCSDLGSLGVGISDLINP